MLGLVRACLSMIVLLTLLLGVGYPLAVTGLAQLAFPNQANGSPVYDHGHLIGSRLLAQGFAKPEYLHPRPSAAGDEGYDATASSGSNLGPMDQKLIDRVAGDAKSLSAESSAAIPVDAVTTSASGLDPDISPENAARQAPRIAAARHVDVALVHAVIAAETQDRTLAVLGEPRVNVLLVNRALDARLTSRK